MADKKVTQLTELTTTADSDLLYIVDDATGTPVSKKVTVTNFFSTVPANTTITGRLVAAANTNFRGNQSVFNANVVFNSAPTANTNRVIVSDKVTVTSNNATTQFGGNAPTNQGSIFWDEDYLYVAVSNTVIKRVALSTFAS
jgi:hypothetical protein